MIFIRKRWRQILNAIVLSILLGVSGLILWAGSQIASPSRRPLLDYHRKFLANPSAHGLAIDRFTASDGTPCLVCPPDPSGKLGDRGSKIRTQLIERGFTLDPAGRILGILVLLNDRKGRKEDYLPIAERLGALGFCCVIPDMPAHGDHPATITTYGIREIRIPSRVLREASEKFAFDPIPAGLLAMSMGGSVAMDAVSLPDAPWKALSIISSFDSFPAVIEGQASRHPGNTLGPLWAKAASAIYHCKSRISITDILPHLHASSLRLPTLIAHSSADRVISIASGCRLYDSPPNTTPRQWIEIAGADHDNVLITSYPTCADIAL